MWNDTPPDITRPTLLRIRQGCMVWTTTVWREDPRTHGRTADVDPKDCPLLLTHPTEPFPVYWDDVGEGEMPYEWAYRTVG